MNHRALQRCLFRLQLDPAFRRLVFARDADALARCDLEEEELELLLAADPVAIGADFEGRRRGQVSGNLVGEFALSHLLASDDLVDGFFGSEAFHDALRQEQALPLAFAHYLRERSEAEGHRGRSALAALEGAMAELRRRPEDEAKAEPFALSNDVEVLELPRGSLDFAQSLRMAIDARRPLPPVPALLLRGRSQELALLQRRAPERRFGLPEIQVEPLQPPVARLLRRCAQGGFDLEARRAYAKDAGAEVSELEGFLSSLVDDGVLRSTKA